MKTVVYDCDGRVLVIIEGTADWDEIRQIVGHSRFFGRYVSL